MVASVQIIQKRWGSNERPTQYPWKAEKSALGRGRHRLESRAPVIDYTRESQVKNETQVCNAEGNQAGRGKTGGRGDRLTAEASNTHQRKGEWAALRQRQPFSAACRYLSRPNVFPSSERWVQEYGAKLLDGLICFAHLVNLWNSVTDMTALLLEPTSAADLRLLQFTLTPTLVNMGGLRHVKGHLYKWSWQCWWWRVAGSRSI